MAVLSPHRRESISYHDARFKHVRSDTGRRLLSKDARSFSGERTVFSTNGAGETGRREAEEEGQTSSPR